MQPDRIALCAGVRESTHLTDFPRTLMLAQRAICFYSHGQWKQPHWRVMKRRYPYYPFYGDDFYNDPVVQRMNLEQEAIYHRLLWAAWKQDQAGTLPCDDDLLVKIIGIRKAQWMKNKEKILPAFSLESDGRWHQKRSEYEYGKLEFKSKTAKRNVESRWKKPDSGNTDVLLGSYNNGNTHASDSVSVSDSSISEKREEKEKSPLPPFRPDPNGDKPLVAEKPRLVDHKKLPWNLTGALDNEQFKEALAAWVRDSKTGYTRTQFMVLLLRFQQECKTAKEAIKTIEFSLSKRAINIIFPTERFTK
jgi:uncharacterized protein YdaU (DUF1376 family)